MVWFGLDNRHYPGLGLLKATRLDQDFFKHFGANILLRVSLSSPGNIRQLPLHSGEHSSRNQLGSQELSEHEEILARIGPSEWFVASARCLRFQLFPIQTPPAK